MARTTLVFGGAGFIGSHVVERFAAAGDRVVVVDGLVPGTGGATRHLAGVKGAIEFRHAMIGELPDLAALVAGADLVVDAMAWTSHMAALDDPFKDLQLNLASHLHLLEALRRSKRASVVYLGSRSQYGRVNGVLNDDTPMDPLDVQGIHKAAADYHYRMYSRIHGLNVISLRLPNCYGERQPATGADIGLVGGFIRTALAGETIRVFGENRQRCLLYAKDAAALVERLAAVVPPGFTAVNAGGLQVSILDLANQIVASAGRGRVETEPIPAAVKAIDAGDASVDESRLGGLIGAVPRTAFAEALDATVTYFKETAE